MNPHLSTREQLRDIDEQAQRKDHVNDMSPEIAGAAARRPQHPRRAAQSFWQLPDNDLDRLLRLAPQADRVELKLSVPRAWPATRGLVYARITGWGYEGRCGWPERAVSPG